MSSFMLETMNTVHKEANFVNTLGERNINPLNFSSRAALVAFYNSMACSMFRLH